MAKTSQYAHQSFKHGHVTYLSTDLVETNNFSEFFVPISLFYYLRKGQKWPKMGKNGPKIGQYPDRSYEPGHIAYV